MTAATEIAPGITVDSFLDGRVEALQHAKGHHRAGLEAVLLAVSLDSRLTGTVADLGAGVAGQMAADYPDAILGSHTGGTNPWIGPQIPDDLTAEEQAFVANVQAWNQTEMAYAMLQASKPQTLAVGLTDSPAGLLAWIGEKMHRWTDHDGDLFAVIDRDTVLTNATIYWMTGTLNSSIRLYAEAVRSQSWAMPQVPVGYLMPDGDFFPTPRSWIERQGPVGHWTTLDRGGHFLELERPQAVADDLRAFFGPLAGRPAALVAEVFADYGRAASFDRELVLRFAGMEIMRRLLGVAQLPFAADLARKQALLAVSRELVLRPASFGD